MKRLLISTVCGLSLAVLLTACGAKLPDRGDLRDGLQDAWEDARDEAWDEAWDDIDDAMEDAAEEEKRHDYQILDGQTGEVLYTVTGPAQVEALDELLGGGGENWRRETSEPADGEAIACVYVFRQERTRLAGEDPQAERDDEEMIRFTVYQDRDLVTMEILKGLEDRLETAGDFLKDLLTVHLSASPETMEALRDPARFADPVG